MTQKGTGETLVCYWWSVVAKY